MRVALTICACIVTRRRRYALLRYETFPAPYDEATGEFADFCRGKQVAVLGSGNAAFEVADMLASCAAGVHILCKNKPRFSWQTHYVGDVRMHNGGIFDRYQLKSLDTLLCHPPGKNTKPVCGGLLDEHRTFNFDTVIYAGGFTTQRDGLVNVTEGAKFPELGEWWSDPAQPNRWYSGCNMHGADFRRSAGGFVHGFRYLVRLTWRVCVGGRGVGEWCVQ